jgi:hypothetical protein
MVGTKALLYDGTENSGEASWSPSIKHIAPSPILYNFSLMGPRLLRRSKLALVSLSAHLTFLGLMLH